MAMNELTTAHAVADNQPKPSVFGQLADMLDATVKQTQASLGPSGTEKTAKTLGEMADWLDTPQEDRRPVSLPGSEWADPINQTVRAISQGATFGFGDEIAAAGDASLDWLFKGAVAGKDWSDLYDKHLGYERGLLEDFREESPVLAMGGEIAGAVPTALATAGVSVAPSAIRAGSNLLGRALGQRAGATGSMVSPTMKRPSFAGRVAKGALGGGASGAVYGYGQGEGGEFNRAASSVIPALFGGGVGAVTPAIGSAVQGVAERIARNKAAKAGDVPSSTVDTLQEAMEIDTGHGGRALDVPTGGVMADAGPGLRSVLDRSIQRTGAASAPARRFADDRATKATDDVTQVMDEVLGTPQGMRTVEGRLRAESAPARRQAYEAAYSTPIDYSSEAGMALENIVRQNVTPDIVRAANKMMQLEGQQSRQILARIGDDGSVTFERLPDVRQLDYMTRAINQLAEGAEGKGAMGGTTPIGRIYQNLSSQIRGLTRELVPAYGEALDIAGDTIRSRKAMELGQSAMRTRITVDQLADEMQGMSQAERQYMVQGVRDYIDNVMAQAKQSYTPQLTASGHIARAVRHDPEALKGLRELSSRANREKIAMLVGDDEARTLFDRLDGAAEALELKDSILENLRRSARSISDEQIAMADSGPGAKLRQGQPIDAAKTLVATLLGAGPRQQRAATHALDEDLINTLLSQADPERMNALAQAARPATVGRRAAHEAEKIVGRGALGVGIPAIQQ